MIYATLLKLQIYVYLVFTKYQMFQTNMGLKPDLPPFEQPRHKCRGNS